jgi:hypothetical protein
MDFLAAVGIISLETEEKWLFFVGDISKCVCP